MSKTGRVVVKSCWLHQKRVKSSDLCGAAEGKIKAGCG